MIDRHPPDRKGHLTVNYVAAVTSYIFLIWGADELDHAQSHFTPGEVAKTALILLAALVAAVLTHACRESED